MSDYTIMHMDREAAEVRGDGTCTIYSDTFLPYNLWLEEDSDITARVNNLTNFNYWCSSRVLSLDRRFAKEILNSLNLPQAVTDRDRAQIAISYHALSLTDVFWIRASDETVSFDEINLYDHPLTDAFVDVSLRGGSLTAQNAELLGQKDTAGDLGTQGVAPKAWIRRDGVFRLLKDGDRRDVEAELLASRIADCFDVRHVPYEADIYDRLEVSRSDIITSKEQSIVPISHMLIYAANHDIDLTDYILGRDEYGYHMMNIIDYLTGNTDRHWENWGFWVDNRTNQPGALYPLMDFNKAFNAYDSLEGALCQTAAAGMSQKDGAVKLSRKTGTGRMSQKDAALIAVNAIGLNQTREVSRDLFTGCFSDERWWNMFCERLNILKRV